MTHEEWREQMVEAIRSGDDERAKELSQIKEKIKKEKAKWCACGKRKQPTATSCRVCANSKRVVVEPRMMTLREHQAHYVRYVIERTPTLTRAAEVLGVTRLTLTRWRKVSGQPVRKYRRALVFNG
jgi:hypothetical protein